MSSNALNGAAVLPLRSGAEVSPAPSNGSASARPKGGGGGAAAKKGGGGASGKAVDFGAVNHLLEHFALIYGTDTAWDGHTRRVVRVANMRLAFSHDAVKMWLGHPSRRMVLQDQLVFEPAGNCGTDDINMWAGFDVEALPCEPEECGPMVRLLRHLCSRSAETADEVEAVVEWVLRWMALPLQKPGTKMQTAIVVHGPQGTGKNLFFDVWRDMFGRHGVTVGQTELEDKFNDWLSCKLAIVGDEVVSRQEMYHHKNKLKLVVTQEAKFPIRAIQQSVRWESNHANVVFLSNESQPLALEERDRRYMVIYAPVADDSGLYDEVAAFLAQDGLRKWLHYLQTYPLGDFTRHTKPLMTAAKTDLIELGWKPAERFANEWLGGFLPLPVRVCSAEQLYRAFSRWASHNGERFPPAQAVFTRSVERWSLERPKRPAPGQVDEHKRVTYKVVKLAHANGERRVMRCWLPAGTQPGADETEGAWAAAGVEAFEAALRSFLRQSFDDGEGA